VLQIGGPTDLFKHPDSVRTTASSVRGPAEMRRRSPDNDRVKGGHRAGKPDRLAPVPGRLVGHVFCYSGVHDDLPSRRDCVQQTDVRLGGVITASRLLAAAFQS
jgi:hypothetical protein